MAIPNYLRIEIRNLAHSAAEGGPWVIGAGLLLLMIPGAKEVAAISIVLGGTMFIGGSLIENAASDVHTDVSAKIVNHDYLVNVGSAEITGVSDKRVVDVAEDGSSIVFDGKTLTGASKYPTDPVWTDGSTIYQLNGTDLTVTDTSTGDTLTITNFTNGDLGIHLGMEDPTPPGTYTTEEVNAKWYNILGFWQASNYPASSSYSSITFDTLSWNIGLVNLDTNPDGAGTWIPTFVLGNVPNLTCPIVPFDNTKILEFNQTLTQVA